MKEGKRISVTIPESERIFKSRTEDDILRILVEFPDEEFTVPELADTTDASPATVRRGVKHLETLDVIEIRKTPQRDYVSIRQERLDKPDPILVIEQSEFRKPIRTFVDETLALLSEADDVTEVVGIVLFGSVARGEADRRSDIDLLVIVDGNRTVARRLVSDVAAELRSAKFDGDRYDFRPTVETVESARRIGERLQQQFEEGIPLHVTDELLELRREVQDGE